MRKFIFTRSKYTCNCTLYIVCKEFDFFHNFSKKIMVSQNGVEPLTPVLSGPCSNQLSYWLKKIKYFKEQMNYSLKKAR